MTVYVSSNPMVSQILPQLPVQPCFVLVRKSSFIGHLVFPLGQGILSKSLRCGRGGDHIARYQPPTPFFNAMHTKQTHYKNKALEQYQTSSLSKKCSPCKSTYRNPELILQPHVQMVIFWDHTNSMTSLWPCLVAMAVVHVFSRASTSRHTALVSSLHHVASQAAVAEDLDFDL